MDLKTMASEPEQEAENDVMDKTVVRRFRA